MDQKPSKPHREDAPEPKGVGLQQPDVTLPNKGLRGAFAHWADWAAVHMPEKWFLVLLSTIVGAIAGVGAWLLRWLIGFITKGVQSFSLFQDHRWLIIFLPTIGFGLTAFFCHKLVKERLEYGTQKIRDALHARSFKMSWKLMWSPILACATTLGLGGSAGSEGPIAYASAAVGSNVGKYFVLQPRYMRILVGVGGGAGIAAIFKAPLGGVFFTLEILKMEMSSIAAIGLVVGCLTAWGVTYSLEGGTLDLGFSRMMDYDPHYLPAVLALGAVCGLYSLYYSLTMRGTERLAAKFKHIWVKVLLTGAIVGPMIYFFPDLYGEGYPCIGKALNGHAYTICDEQLIWHDLDTTRLIILLLWLAGIKAIGTAATNSGGGVGGEFTPTLFAGAMLGALFAVCCNQWLGTEMPIGYFALCGMAGVMAGGVQAPLMAMFIVVEMCGDFAMFFPLFITSCISYIVTISFNHQFRLKVLPAFLHMH